MKYMINTIDDNIYKLNGNVVIDEFEMVRFTMKESEKNKYQFITKEQYLDIYCAMKHSSGSWKEQKEILILIKNTIK